MQVQVEVHCKRIVLGWEVVLGMTCWSAMETLAVVRELGRSNRHLVAIQSQTLC